MSKVLWSNGEAILATHKVSFYGVRCYMNDYTTHMWGTNKFMDMLIPLAAFWHNYFIAPFMSMPGFPLRVLEEY